jgi:hypothetical protein
MVNPSAPHLNLPAILPRLTRDQGPEFEQTLSFTGLTQVSTLTSLRTDRKISVFDLHIRGRITVGAGAVTFRAGPSLLGTPLFSLLQQITVRGQHLRYGAQTPILVRGESAAEYLALMLANYQPQFTVSVNGAAPVRGGALSGAANATNDFDLVLPIFLFPADIAASDIPFYCLHGPDWPGNIYMDVACADVTALGVTTASIANYSATNGGVTAYGGSTGQATIDILSERPLLSKDLMASIRGALTFRTTYPGQPTAAVQGASGSGLKLSDLTVGKDTARIFVKTGTLQSGLSSGLTVYGSLSDGIITRTVLALDNRQLRFQNANADSVLQDYHARKWGRTIPIGYKMLDFISVAGPAPANPKAAFPSSKLTAARKFEVDADITAAANQIAEVVQEMILGRPALLAGLNRTQ